MDNFEKNAEVNASMSSKAFSDKPEEVTNKENYNSSQTDSDLGIPFSIHDENVDKVSDCSSSLKRKSNSFDSIDNEIVTKKSKIDDDYPLNGVITSSDDVATSELELYTTKKEDLNTTKKLCVTEQKELFSTEKQEECVPTEKWLPITEKQELGITENKELGIRMDEVVTSDESDDTDDGSDDTDDGSDDTDDGSEKKKPEPISRPEAVKFPVLYRLLRDDEDIKEGLKPKNPNSCISVAEHVASGSNGGRSRYISTSSDISKVQSFRNLKSRSRHRNGTKEIVKIDVNKLPKDVRIIDLTEQTLREQYIGRASSSIISKFHQHAAKFGEVLLEGTVPSYCLVTVSL